MTDFGDKFKQQSRKANIAYLHPGLLDLLMMINSILHLLVHFHQTSGCKNKKDECNEIQFFRPFHLDTTKNCI